MDPLASELAALRRRLRLRTLVFFGALFVTAASLGGAREAVRIFVESDAWVVATREDPGSGTDKLNRLVVTGDTDVARIRVEEANLHLAQQSSAPSSPNPGSLWYDNSVGRLKYRGPTAWMDPSDSHRFVWKPSDETNSTSTLQDDDHLKIPIGANEKWEIDIWIIGSSDGGPAASIQYAVAVPSGCSVHYWALFDDSSPPPNGVSLRYGDVSGTGIRAKLASSGPAGYMIHVSVTNGSTAGDVVLQWASWPPGSTQWTVKAGSVLEATRIP